MSPQVQRQPHPYIQIAEHYRDLIRKGKLKPGDGLPSARQMMKDWNVAIATAAKVITLLRVEGYVLTTAGGAGGTVVAPYPGQAPRDRMLSVRGTGRIYPEGEHARIVSAELVPAPEHVADALGVAIGDTVIRRHRVTYREEDPVSASTSWFTGDLASVAPDLLVAERIKAGTPGYIEKRTGRTMASGRDQVCAGKADRVAASELGVKVGSPVLCGRNWVRDTLGEVIEFGEYVSIPERWQVYEYALP